MCCGYFFCVLVETGCLKIGLHDIHIYSGHLEKGLNSLTNHEIMVTLWQTHVVFIAAADLVATEIYPPLSWWRMDLWSRCGFIALPPWKRPSEMLTHMTWLTFRFARDNDITIYSNYIVFMGLQGNNYITGGLYLVTVSFQNCHFLGGTEMVSLYSRI